MQSAGQIIATQAERIAAIVLAALWPKRELRDIAKMLQDAPVARWRFYVWGTLAGLVACALLAASFGPVGLAVYFGLIVVLVR